MNQSTDHLSLNFLGSFSSPNSDTKTEQGTLKQWSRASLDLAHWVIPSSHYQRLQALDRITIYSHRTLGMLVCIIHPWLVLMNEGDGNMELITTGIARWLIQLLCIGCVKITNVELKCSQNLRGCPFWVFKEDCNPSEDTAPNGLQFAESAGLREKEQGKNLTTWVALGEWNRLWSGMVIASGFSWVERCLHNNGRPHLLHSCKIKTLIHCQPVGGLTGVLGTMN